MSKIDFPLGLSGLDVLQVYDPEAAEPARRAVRFAARIASKHGARLYRTGETGGIAGAFYDVEEVAEVPDPAAWLAEAPTQRLILRACVTGADEGATPEDNTIFVALDPWHSEATLYAASGLADINGHPDEAPLVPAAHYASHTLGYGAFGAITALYAGLSRFGRRDCATVHGLGLLGWVNWKAGAAGALGQELTRKGPDAEWPILECADGHVSCLYTERDWPAMIKMVGDPALEDPRFATFEGRAENRDGYMGPIRAWAARHSKDEIRAAFDAHSIPGAPVSTIADVLADPLFAHRGAFEPSGTGQLPVLPERVIAQTKAAQAAPKSDDAAGTLPLSGITVLDLGIITAGAGVGAVLADLGATVLKIESATYPDPFRAWAGSDDSPLFRFNNRNKKGLAIDLKTESGKARFLELAQSADIVIENFRRGVLDRLGLDFETLSAANPSILVASISGQGHSGPGTHTSTFGSTLEASSGFSALTRDIRGLPYITGRELNYPDQIICVYGAAVIASAVLDSRKSGIGRHIDISQRDCALYQIGDVIEAVSSGTPEDIPSVRRAICDRPVEGIVTCADGDHLALTAPAGADLSVIEGLAQGRLADWARAHDSAGASLAFTRAGFGAQRALKGSEMVELDAVRRAGVFAKGIRTGMVKGFPFQFHAQPMTIHLDAPNVGEHNAEFGLEEPTS